MLFLDVFENNLHIFLTLMMLLILAFSVWKARDSEQNRALFFEAVAIGLFFAVDSLKYLSEFFYRQGVPVKIYTLAEILLILCTCISLLISTHWLLFRKYPEATPLFGLTSVALLLGLYAVFIDNNTTLLVHVRLILPMICLTCLMLAFLSRITSLKYVGNLTAGISASAFVGLMICNLLEIGPYPWFVPVDLILLTAFSFYVIHVEDMSERLRLITARQERMVSDVENIVRSSPFPIMISRLQDDRLLLVNRNAVKLFGLNENELDRYRFKDFFVDPDNRHLLLEKLEKTQGAQNFEILVRSANRQTPFWLLLSANVIDYENSVVLYSAFQDITDRKRRENLLQNQANCDPLTSISNRRFFEENLPQKITQARRQKQPFAILMIDADHFKNINDTYGHKIGDKVLIELASVCERQLRSEDLVARYGGEEFIIFLNNVTSDTACIVANRLREAIGSSVVYTEDNVRVPFTVSIGVAPSGISDSPDTLIKMADDAMYLAKQNGRNKIEIYSAEQIENAKKQKAWSETPKSQTHPAYFSEENAEISLLDGIESTHILED